MCPCFSRRKHERERAASFSLPPPCMPFTSWVQLSGARENGGLFHSVWRDGAKMRSWGYHAAKQRRKHAGIFHHYSFPFSSHAIQATNIRKSKCLFYSRDIFLLPRGNGSKMLIETFSRGGILKMPPSSAEVGRNSIP